MNINKFVVLLIISIGYTNISCASFPILDTLEVHKHILQTETVGQYHLRIQKMGFDISTCNCKDCRAGKFVPQEVLQQDTLKWYAKGNMPLLWIILFLSLIVVIYFMIIFFNGLDECSACLA